MKATLIYWLMGSAIAFIFFIVHYVEVLPYLHRKKQIKFISWIPAARYFKDAKLYAELCEKEGKPLNWYSLDVKAQILLFIWAVTGLVLYFAFDINIVSVF